MSTPSDSRQAILQAIRDGLAASARHEEAYADARRHDVKPPEKGIPLPLAPRDHAPQEEWVPEVLPSSVEQFGTRLEAVGGEWCVLPNRAAARDAVLAILRDAAARRVAISDAPLVRAVVSGGGASASFEFLEAPSRTELFEADAGISCAQWAIAESGTLILESNEERHRLVSLVPPIHIALVPTSRLCGTLGDALGRIRGEGRAPKSRSITFVTGPSRTADIEQMLVLGVHGPQSLFVIFVQDEGPPDA